MRRIASVFVLLVFMCSGAFFSHAQSRISVSGNAFVDEEGKTVIFRGFSSSDPHKLDNDGLWNKRYFRELKKWGVNIVRFPVHPPNWRLRGEEEYLKLLDNGIKWAKSQGMYVIMDWHSIGNLHTARFQNDIYVTSIEETHAFWKTIAIRYGENKTVAFYELFNEPTTYNGTLGEVTWERWSEMNMAMIKTVRENGGEGVPLIAGFNWAYDLTAAGKQPVPAENIAYVSHPYPQKESKPWGSKWTKSWGFLKEKYPLILTEIGFSEADEPGAHVPVISDESYGESIIEYCEQRGISFVVWVFDKDWSPRMYKDDKFTPSKQGGYFKKRLQELSRS